MKRSSKSKSKRQSNGKNDSGGTGGGGGVGWGLLSWDKRVSERMAVCSSEKSTLGHLRPLMRALEYSCHGVPWLVCTIAGIVAAHNIELQVKLMNLLLGSLILFFITKSIIDIYAINALFG